MALLAADWVRFGRRRDLRLVVALLPVILALMFVMEFNTLTTPPQADFFFDPPDPVAEADLRAQMLADWRDRLVVESPAFAFPASLRQGRRGTSGRWPCWRSTWRSRWSRRSSNGAPSGPST